MGRRFSLGNMGSTFPTRDDMLEVMTPAIVATCRSVLNTSTPVRTLGEVTHDTKWVRAERLKRRQRQSDLVDSLLKLATDIGQSLDRARRNYLETMTPAWIELMLNRHKRSLE